jgi:Uma2 family endonuclease
MASLMVGDAPLAMQAADPDAREIEPMATTPRTSAHREVDYPTSDGRPMAETDLHRQDMVDLIETLQDRFAADPDVYVSGDLLLFYEEGNRRRHVGPDVFVVRGVSKEPPRDHYLLWKEGKGPDVVIEITSKTTRREDQKKKLVLYRDVLKVPEYFQFDPTEDYLKPPLQGHRLVDGAYVPIDPVAGRLPSLLLGLHLERDGHELRLHDPAMGQRLRTGREQTREERAARHEAEMRARRAEAEVEELRRQLEALRRGPSGPDQP